MISTTQQPRRQWLADRQKGVGGSDAAAAVGLSPWKTQYQLWLEKTQPVRDDEPTDPMLWGTLLEPVIRQRYCDVTGWSVINPNQMLVHPQHPFALANLDGVVEGCPERPRLLEAKTARTADGWGDPGTSEVPEHYLLQVQHYMGVTGYEVTDIPVLIGGSDFRIYTVEADEELQRDLFDQEAEFWKYVIERRPPAPTNAEDIKQRWAKCINRDLKEATPEDVALWKQLGKVRAKLKDLEAEKENIESALKLRIKDGGGLSHNGKPIVTWRSNKSSTVFDRARFEKDHPDLVNQYMAERPGARPFLFKEPKA